MRALRYPRFISLNSFIQPNYALMSDALLWLYHRFDPDARIDPAIDTSQARVALLKSLAEGLLLKAGVKVNLKRLYAADIQAVRELLHLALLLYRANSHDTEAAVLPQVDDGDIAAPMRGMDLHAARRLVSEVAHTGALLHDRLCAESRQYELRERCGVHVESCEKIHTVIVQKQHAGCQPGHGGRGSLHQRGVGILTGSLAYATIHHRSGAGGSTVRGNVRIGWATTNQQLPNRLTQERLSRKQTELEHIQKRMATLASVRPPHMAEMEALQVQLQELFTQYASRFRNLQYMRLQLDLQRDAEREAMAEADRHRRRLLRRLKKEELRILRGEVRCPPPPSRSILVVIVAGWQQRRRQRQ